MKAILLCLLFLLASTSIRAADAPPAGSASLIICTGLGGEPEYQDAFALWSRNWQKAGATAGIQVTDIGRDAAQGQDLANLRSAIEKESPAGAEPLWIVLIGHGTFDGHDARFNLRGPDLAPADLALMLAPFTRPVVVIGAFSSSGAFLAPLSKPGRIIITATRSGAESNFSRLGKYLSEAIADPAADLNHDGQTSLLEAWLSASLRVADFYKSEGRLATEHSLLDDNGDGRGTPTDWFTGLRVTKKSSDGRQPDGLRAGQIHLVQSAAERAWPPDLRAKRDSLEVELARLRETKATLSEADYLSQIEPLLLDLARLYHQANPPPETPAPPP